MPEHSIDIHRVVVYVEVTTLWVLSDVHYTVLALGSQHEGSMMIPVSRFTWSVKKGRNGWVISTCWI